MCRFNREGRFNTPFGKYRSIPYQRDFREYQSTLSGWELCCGDFESIALESGDFVYADPPYDGDDTSFVGYSKECFDWADQERLAEWLAKHPGPVVASNKATTRIIRAYQSLGFEIQTIKGRSSRINCKGDARGPTDEILATRNCSVIARAIHKGDCI